MLTLKCREAGFDCNRIIEGDDQQEILDKVSEHALKDHGLKQGDFTEEMIEKIKSIIKEI